MLVNVLASIRESINCAKKVSAFREHIRCLLGTHYLNDMDNEPLRSEKKSLDKVVPKKTIGITLVKLLYIH